MISSYISTLLVFLLGEPASHIDLKLQVSCTMDALIDVPVELISRKQDMELQKQAALSYPYDTRNTVILPIPKKKKKRYWKCAEDLLHTEVSQMASLANN